MVSCKSSRGLHAGQGGGLWKEDPPILPFCLWKVPMGYIRGRQHEGSESKCFMHAHKEKQLKVVTMTDRPGI